MKKLLTIAAVAGMFAFIACGPSAEDKAKAAAHIADSLRADSTAKAQAMKMKQDSAAKAQAMKTDSTKKDSAAH